MSAVKLFSEALLRCQVLQLVSTESLLCEKKSIRQPYEKNQERKIKIPPLIFGGHSIENQLIRGSWQNGGGLHRH